MEKSFTKIFYFLYAIYFLLNLIGSPLLTYLYPLIFLLAVIRILTSSLDIGIYTLLIFSFIEGQGRILLGYNFVARASLDILILFIFLRALISHKSLFAQEYLPQFIKLMLAFHFLWWIAELFHPLGLPPWFGVLTARYYLMPIFLFTLSLNIDITSENKNFERFTTALLLFYIGEIAISYVQFFGGADFLKGISANYYSLFAKFSVFEGATFRAFGTSFGPGGYVSHLYLATPMLFLTFQNKAWYKFIVLPLVIIAAWVAFFFSGVRSAWLKNIMVIVGISFFFFIKDKVKFKSTVQVVVLTTVLALLSVIFFSTVQLKGEGYDLTGKISRVMEILSTEDQVEVGGEKIAVKQKAKHRMDFTDFGNYLTKAELPFGTGIGMGGVNIPGAVEARSRRVDKDLDFFWTGDNLYFFLIFEQGLGALFLISVIFTLPFYFAKGVFGSMQNKNNPYFAVLTICLVSTVTSIIGNWGAVSIVFAPESLFFWFIAGIGMRQYFKFVHYKEDDNLLLDE